MEFHEELEVQYDHYDIVAAADLLGDDVTIRKHSLENFFDAPIDRSVE